MSVRERLRQFIHALAVVSSLLAFVLFLSVLPVTWALTVGDATTYQVYNGLWRFIAAVGCGWFGARYAA